MPAGMCQYGALQGRILEAYLATGRPVTGVGPVERRRRRGERLRRDDVRHSVRVRYREGHHEWCGECILQRRSGGATARYIGHGAYSRGDTDGRGEPPTPQQSDGSPLDRRLVPAHDRVARHGTEPFSKLPRWLSSNRKELCVHNTQPRPTVLAKRSPLPRSKRHHTTDCAGKASRVGLQGAITWCCAWSGQTIESAKAPLSTDPPGRGCGAPH